MLKRAHWLRATSEGHTHIFNACLALRYKNMHTGGERRVRDTGVPKRVSGSDKLGTYEPVVRTTDKIEG